MQVAVHSLLVLSLIAGCTKKQHSDTLLKELLSFANILLGYGYNYAIAKMSSLDSGISSCHETQGSVVVMRLGDQ